RRAPGVAVAPRSARRRIGAGRPICEQPTLGDGALRLRTTSPERGRVIVDNHLLDHPHPYPRPRHPSAKTPVIGLVEQLIGELELEQVSQVRTVQGRLQVELSTRRRKGAELCALAPWRVLCDRT